MGVYQIQSKKRKNFFPNLSVNVSLILINVILFIFFILLILFEIIPIDYVAIKPSNIFLGKYILFAYIICNR